MSVSLIMGIGEKVRPGRLTTPRGGSLCVYVCVLLTAYPNVYVCVSYSYLCLSLSGCVGDKEDAGPGLGQKVIVWRRTGNEGKRKWH